MRVAYSDQYDLNLGNHVFPSAKYRLVKERLLHENLISPEEIVEPSPASDDDVALVHDRDYIWKLKNAKLSHVEILRMEIPYSPELVRAVWLSAGGSILAGRLALEDGVCVNIGGGFHHAFPDHGEGFCMINDFAVAIRVLQKQGRIRRAMTVDCDVHQGNGTAAIFGGSAGSGNTLPSSSAPVLGTTANASTTKDVFTISLHQEHNYPYVKPASSIDVNLPDGCGDAEYLAWLDNALSSGLRQFEPELICYVAGADPFR